MKLFHIKLILLCLLSTSSFCAKALGNESGKSDIITLIVCGGGKSEAEAKHTAMISALRQTFCVFISDKMEILNKQALVEECLSPTSGCIQSCEILVNQQLSVDIWATTARVVLSVSKLLEFIQKKGISAKCQFDESIIIMRKSLLEQLEEEEALAQMTGVLHEPMQIAYNYDLTIGTPKSSESETPDHLVNWELPLIITAIANKTMDNCSDYFLKTLSMLGMSTEEVRIQKARGKLIYEFTQVYQELPQTFYLRSKVSKSILTIFKSNFEFYVRSFNLTFNNVEMDGNANVILSKDNATFNFPHSGQTGATFSYFIKPASKTAPPPKGYTVKASGVRSSCKSGGYVVYESKGHGIVSSLMEVGGQMEMNWTQADSLCKKLFSNGFNDWRLPTIEEQKLMYTNLENKNIAGFRTGKKRQVIQAKERVGNVHHPIRYWSADANTVLDFETGQEEQVSDFIGACFIRAVRSF